MTDLHSVLRVECDRLVSPIHYLEIGTQEGRSLRCVAGHPAVALAVAIDTWGGEAGGTNRKTPDHVVDLLGEFMSKVVVITGDSHTILRGLRHRFNLILVDGDHSAQGARQDLDEVLPLLDMHGTLIADDCDHPVHPYLRGVFTRFASENNLCMGILSGGYGIAKFVRKPVAQ